MDPALNAAKPGKKRKRESPQSQLNEDSSVLELESQILDSRRHYNKIVTLLNLCWGRNPQNDKNENTLAGIALCRIFCRLLALGHLSKSPEMTENEATVMQWLNDRYSDYKDVLLNAISKGEASIQSTALTLLMRLFKEEATHLRKSDGTVWRTGIFPKVLDVLLGTELSADVRDEFMHKYVAEYNDVRFYTFVHLSNHATREQSHQSLSIMISMLAAVENVPENPDDLTDFYLAAPPKSKHVLYSPSAHKKQAQEAWLAVLRQHLTKQQRKTVLGMMSRRIAPWFLKVELLMDFLTDSFDEGGSTSLMALSGLFYLIQRKNLDYPQFYQKLYSMLDYNLMHSKQRSRFFRLLETFLSSTHLPAALVASFIKRLSRLALNAPPAAIVVIVPLIYNLLRSHPMCTFMIHRAVKSPRIEGDEDLFRMDETDPMETHAIESSLWEIHNLQDHYHPNVATIAKIISQPFTKQGYNLEDFLDHSYESMLHAELSKDIKRPPEIDYAIPKRIFSKHDPVSGQEDNLMVKLFSFT